MSGNRGIITLGIICTGIELFCTAGLISLAAWVPVTGFRVLVAAFALVPATLGYWIATDTHRIWRTGVV